MNITPQGRLQQRKEIWNKCVLSCRLNKSILTAVRIESGRLFHAARAATANAESSNFIEGVRLGWMSFIVDVNADTSVLRRSLMSSVIQRSERSLGAIPFRALYTIRHNLNWIHSRHRSQWRVITKKRRHMQEPWRTKNKSSCTVQDGLKTVYLALLNVSI